MEEVVKIEEITMEMKRKGFEFTRDHIPTKVSVKLPKLKMKKFEGNSLRLVSVLESVWNWNRSSLNKSYKYVFLSQGTFCTKGKFLIDELPFTSEGYARAKSILTSRYGKVKLLPLTSTV